MALTLHEDIKKKIGENIAKLIGESTDEKTLRKIDALTGKDHSWIAKVFKGQMNITIDSLITMILAYRLNFTEVFKVQIDYSSIGEKDLFEYLISKRKTKNNKKGPSKSKAKVTAKRKSAPKKKSK